MVAVEEKNIRTNLSARTSVLLQRVFALQDKEDIILFSKPLENYKKNSSRHRYKTSLKTGLILENKIKTRFCYKKI
jgi:hypothetical protein